MQESSIDTTRDGGAWTRPPDVLNLRLRVGSDPEVGDPFRTMVLCWTTGEPVVAPRVLMGAVRGGDTRMIVANTLVECDRHTGAHSFVHRARLTRLRPGATYVVAVTFDGGVPIHGAFRVEDTHADTRGRGTGAGVTQIRLAAGL